MTRRSARLETPIQRDIEAALGAEPDLLLLRNTVGTVKYYDERTGELRYVTYGLGVGSPDLVAVLAPSGRWVCFEVKADGGVVGPEQRKCHDIWRRFGALVFVVRSVAEARAALDGARREACSCNRP